MRKSRLRRPSPALVVAFVALFAAAGGGAYASSTSDTKSDKKIANKAAKTYFNKHIAGASVSHANTAGSATDATNAMNATNATNATNASNVGGVSLGHFFATDPTGTALHTIATIGPITLEGACSGGGIADLRGAVNETSNEFQDVDSNPVHGTAMLTSGTFADLTPAAEVTFGGIGTAHYLLYISHKDIQVTFFVRPSGALGAGTGCFYTGYVTSD